MSRRGGLVPFDRDDPLVYVLRYLRVSGKEQKDKGISIPTQDALTSAYLLKHADDGWIEYGRYEDVLSGRRNERHDYQRVLEDIRELRARRKRVVVVVQKTDRIGRRLSERTRAWEELFAEQAELHAVMEGGKQDRLAHNIRALLSEEEVAALSERVTATRAFVIERGWRPIGRAPWGYVWVEASEDDRQRGAPKLVLARGPDVEWRAAEEAWRMRADEGGSVHAIARWAARLTEAQRGGRNLNYAAIRQMFGACVYIARPETHYVNAEPRETPVLDRPRGNWPAMVDDAAWERALALRAAARKMPPQASQRYLLTGLIRCWRCGHRMYGHASLDRRGLAQGKQWRTVAYRCSSIQLGADGAAVACLAEAPAAVVERLVLDELRTVLAVLDRPEVVEQLERLEAQALAARGGATDARTAIAEQTARMNRAREVLAAAGEARLTGEIPPAEYRIIADKQMADIEAAQATLVGLRGRVRAVPVPLGSVLARVSGWSERLAATADVAAARVALGELLERVVPLPSGGRWAKRWEVQLDLTETGLVLAEAGRVLGEPSLVGYFEQPKYPTQDGDPPSAARPASASASGSGSPRATAASASSSRRIDGVSTSTRSSSRRAG